MDIKDTHKDYPTRPSLTSLFWTFIKIGSTAFGGFMALISVVPNYVVERRYLLTHEEMLDGVSLATILPGPIAFNVVAYEGYRLGYERVHVASGEELCFSEQELQHFNEQNEHIKRSLLDQTDKDDLLRRE
jgi:hypothetical protein